MTEPATAGHSDLRPHEAAAMLGVPSQEVYRLLMAHQLEGRRRGERLVIVRSSVERFLSENRT